MSAIFLLSNARSRVEIATSIERLINLLDDMESDPDVEDEGSAVPSSSLSA